MHDTSQENTEKFTPDLPRYVPKVEPSHVQPEGSVEQADKPFDEPVSAITDTGVISAASYFDVQERTVSNDKLSKLNSIVAYARKNVGNNQAEVLNFLRETERRLGTPPLGRTRIDHMNMYIRLAETQSQAKQQMKEMEHGY